MKRRVSRLWIIGILLLLGAVWWYNHSGKEKGGSDHKPVLVSIAEVTHADVPLEVKEVGTVIPYESVAVRSRLDSQITEVKFHDGDVVKQGDVLFVLDDRALKAQLGAAEANVTRDRAQMENLRQQYVRSQTLVKKGFDSLANLDEAKAAYEAQKAVVGATEAARNNVQVQFDYTRILAPIGGRTGTINVTVGNNVKANDTTPLVTINQVQPIRVQAALAQSYFEPLRAAMNAGSVEVAAMREGAGAVATGAVEYLDNTVDQNNGTFVTRALFANAEEFLWPGMFVTLDFKLGSEKNAVVVPEVAVQHSQDSDFVFVIKEDKASQRPVKIKRMQGNLAVVAEGLQAGELVAVDGIMSLKDGSAVNMRQKVAKDEGTPAPDAASKGHKRIHSGKAP